MEQLECNMYRLHRIFQLHALIQVFEVVECDVIVYVNQFVQTHMCVGSFVDCKFKSELKKFKIKPVKFLAGMLFPRAGHPLTHL